MYHAVELLVVVVYLAGMALGLRFRVAVLIPAGIVVLALSTVVLLMWPGVTRWGLTGAPALLVVLNVGFAFGILLRAGAAFWSTRKTSRLFARPADAVPSAKDAEREAGSEGVSLKAATIGRHELASKVLHR